MDSFPKTTGPQSYGSANSANFGSAVQEQLCDLSLYLNLSSTFDPAKTCSNDVSTNLSG